MASRKKHSKWSGPSGSRRDKEDEDHTDGRAETWKDEASHPKLPTAECLLWGTEIDVSFVQLLFWFVQLFCNIQPSLNLILVQPGKKKQAGSRFALAKESRAAPSVFLTVIRQMSPRRCAHT